MTSKAFGLAQLGNAFSDGALSNRNKIINGAMTIDQRSAGAAATINGVYASADRWKAGNDTNTGTIQQITSTLAGFKNSIKYTAAGAGTFFQLGQQIEFSNCYDLQNKTITISFRAKANNANAGSTGLIVRTRTGATVDGVVIFAGTNVDTSITLTTSDAFYTVTRTLPATFGALSVEFQLPAHVAGDGFELTGVQLEAGDTATPFEHRSYGQELALCHRYFSKSYNVGTALGTNTGNSQFDASSARTSSTGYYGTEKFKFPSAMRAAPTISFWTYNGTANQWHAGVNGVSETAYAVVSTNVNETGFCALMTGVNGTYNISYGHWAASAEL